MRELTAGAFEKASSILRKYRTQLDEGAKLLLQKEMLTRDELPLLGMSLPAVAAASRATA